MRKRWIFLLIILIAVQICSAQLRSGIDYSNRHFWVVFRPELEGITIQQTGNHFSSGLPSVDALFRRFDVNRVAPEIPAAQPWDRDGDIVFANVFQVEIKPTENILSIVSEFAADPNVILAEPIPIYYPEEVVPYIPNDPLFNNEWHLAKIEAPMAWGMWFGATPGSDTVVVAIIDTGVDWDHPDLLGNIFVNPGEDLDGDGEVGDYGTPGAGGDENGVDDDGNGYVDDLMGWDFCGATVGNFVPDNNPHSSVHQGVGGLLMHGTHVAGTASPVSNNGAGVAGPGFTAKIMPIKVAFDNDYQNTPGVYASASTYLYAAKTGAHVFNCSYGGPGYSGVIQSAINLAHDTYGSIIVAAAGNDNVNLQQNPHYPSDYNNVISVAALNSGDIKAGFSNYGPSIDISAPGVGIWSTVYKNVSGGYQGSQWSGTSMASPVVAGSIALLKAFFPAKSISWLEQRIVNSADPIDALNPTYAGMLGSGRVNAFSAIAQGILPSLQYQAHTLQITGNNNGQLNPGESALMRVTLKNEAGWNTAAGITATLRNPSGDLIVTDSTATYPNIAPGSIGINIADRFEFTVDSNSTIGNVPVELYVKANQDSAVAYDITLQFDITVSIDQAGWPQVIGGTLKSSPVVIDLDGDSQAEVVATSTDGNVYLWKNDGNMAPGYPFATGGQIVSSPAAGNVDNAGHPELVVTSKSGHLFILKGDGTVVLDYDAGTQLWGTPSLVDLDGNGDLEIVFGDYLGKLHAIHHNGTSLSGFPLDLGSTHRILGGVAIGDINNDAVADLSFGTFNGDVYSVSSADGSILNGFPVSVGARVEGAPVIADLDGAGPLPVQLVVASLNKLVSLINGQGTLSAQFAFPGAIKGTPALSDLDNNGLVDILFGCEDNKMYAINPSGNSLPGFPIATGNSVSTSPVVADLSGDGIPEIAFESRDGKLYLVDAAGAAVPGFPLTIGGLLEATPTFSDVDADGDLEILAGAPGSLQIYDIPKQGNTAQQWFTLQGNYARSSNLATVLTRLDNKDSLEPATYALWQNYPNPFNPDTRIEFSLPAAQNIQLTVYNTLGQRIRSLASGFRSAGVNRVTWNGRDDRGSLAASGIYIYRLETPDMVLSRKMILLR